ncbi:hypothetical protein, partial [Flagellimonas meishanensis]|uniref:hypothetical protein n=1 Tax=Flagellimonas meishanensis TaxID=2873264 RepID=UPI001CA6BC4D
MRNGQKSPYTGFEQILHEPKYLASINFELFKILIINQMKEKKFFFENCFVVSFKPLYICTRLAGKALRFSGVIFWSLGQFFFGKPG